MLCEKMPEVDIQALLNLTTSMMDLEKEYDLEWDLSAPSVPMPLNDNDAMQQAEDLSCNRSATYTQLSLLKNLDLPEEFSCNDVTTSSSDVMNSLSPLCGAPVTRPTRLPSVSTFKLSPDQAFMYNPNNEWPGMTCMTSSLSPSASVTSVSPTPLASLSSMSPTSVASFTSDFGSSLSTTPTPMTSLSPSPIEHDANVIKMEADPVPTPAMTSQEKRMSPKPKRRKSRARKHSNEAPASLVTSPTESSAGATRKFSTHVLPPCRVCGAQATGFHYGANTCEPCKVRPPF